MYLFFLLILKLNKFCNFKIDNLYLFDFWFVIISKIVFITLLFILFNKVLFFFKQVLFKVLFKVLLWLFISLFNVLISIKFLTTIKLHFL